MSISAQLTENLLKALNEIGLEIPDPSRIKVKPADDLRYGDYQSTVAMMMAKPAKRNPRELAAELMEKLESVEIADVSIAGPGFLNFMIKPQAWADEAKRQWSDPAHAVTKVQEPQTIVLDFSAPNVAKPMHIGHIRSTIIGECLGRVGTRLGHNVIKDNHIGDWGTQFGMVTWAWKKGVDESLLESDPLQELLRLYRTASQACKENDAIRDICRNELVALQNGEAENIAIWNRCMDLSKDSPGGLNELYKRLGVSFDHWMGESAYNDALGPLVEKLEQENIARENDGALCIFSDESGKPKEDPFKVNRDGEWLDYPMIVRKEDGAFNYATTDIATIEFRVNDWKADKIWYVVDFRQSGHFTQLFEVAMRMDYKDVELTHIAFGTILGKDGKPLKTRAGDLPLLSDVLDDAVKAARSVIGEKSHLDTEEEKDALAELIGVNSVKFTELAHHRLSDYVFDLEKMVALEGDTAPYLFYSYVRARSIFRKLEEGEFEKLNIERLTLSEPAEIHLVRMLTRFGDNVNVVLDDFRPNLLATYLLELARSYHSYFEACPVLKSEGAVRESRLLLCDLTSRVIKDGLNLLGIDVPERM